MRPIKFKAKTSDGEWVESTSIQNNPFGKTYLMDTKRLVECYNKEVMPSNIWVEIDPNTLCQFTGLTDKNGKEVYEGDILIDEYCGSGYDEPINYMITYDNQEAKFKILDGGYSHYLGEGSQDCYGDFGYTDELRDMSDTIEMEVIGNIHDKTGER